VTVLRHRLPFTSAVLLAIIAIGIATVTGSFRTLTPIFYLPVLRSFGLFAGFAEWRVGTRRAAVICALGQMAGVFGAALTLLLFRGTTWP